MRAPLIIVALLASCSDGNRCGPGTTPVGNACLPETTCPNGYLSQNGGSDALGERTIDAAGLVSRTQKGRLQVYIAGAVILVALAVGLIGMGVGS